MGASTTMMTVREFLQLPEPEGERMELIGGEVVTLSHGGYPHEKGAPLIAIEVVSSETAATLERKIDLYLARGSKSVWAVFPQDRVVRIFEASGLSRKFEEHQTLEDPIPLPGFSTPVSAIFEGI